MVASENDNCSLMYNCELTPQTVSTLYTELFFMDNWIRIGIMLLGVFNNALALKILHQLKMLGKKQMIFFTAGLLTNLTTCLVMFLQCCAFVGSHMTGKHEWWTQVDCLLVLTPGGAAVGCSQRIVLAIAVERLWAQWCPYQWFRWNPKGKWVIVVALWTWATFQETFWFYFVCDDECVAFCAYGYQSYPDIWWQYFAVVSDNFVNLLILLCVLAVPLVTIFGRRSPVKQVKRECFIIHEHNVFLKSREMLARVRLLSFIYVLGFCCTMLLGVLLNEVSIIPQTRCIFDITVTSSLPVVNYYQVVAYFLQNFHIAFTPLVFLLDASFRWELGRYVKTKFLRCSYICSDQKTLSDMNVI